MAPELTSDFSEPWARDLIADPSWHPVPTFSRSISTPPNTENSLLASTLHASNCVRAIQYFHASGPSPSSPVGHESRMLWSLGSGLNGHSGFSHGGLISMMLDEVTGQCAARAFGRGILTAQLNVKYKKMLPTPSVVLCRAWVEREVEGRKLWVRGEVSDGKGGEFAVGETLFVLRGPKL